MLVGFCFPPFDLGPLVLIALVPLLWAWRDTTPRWAALYGLLFGIAFFGVLLEWSRYFGAVAIIPLSGGGRWVIDDLKVTHAPAAELTESLDLFECVRDE